MRRTALPQAINKTFLNDVLTGLSAPRKYLSSKYFYDKTGDHIFQEIMDCPEYYLTKCELEIFSRQTQQLSDAIQQKLLSFDVVEMGAGDATKSSYLLSQLAAEQKNFTYYPIDISRNVISLLEDTLPDTIQGLNIHGLNGEYFEMLEKVKTVSNRKKVVLFLGSNIGNIPLEEVASFCKDLRSHLSKGDLLIIGFDLKKDPAMILRAYNDSQGITRRFNLNLLHRINRELDADFNIKAFEHRPEYNPQTGSCKSYLVSTRRQDVTIAERVIHFEAGEPVFMEVSQKYTVQQTDELARATGFKTVQHFFDSRRYFLDAMWECV